MLIREIAAVVEAFAPLAWQEDYDNAGLIVGRPDDEVHAALLAVDVTEEVLDEAEARGCDLVITHHPILFRALNRPITCSGASNGPSGAASHSTPATRTSTVRRTA